MGIFHKPMLVLFAAAFWGAGHGNGAVKPGLPVESPAKPSGHEGHDHSNEGADSESVWGQVGPGNAIEGFEPEESRILMSAKAQKRLGVVLETSRRESAGLWVEASALVYEDIQAQIYLVDSEGWFVRTPVRLGQKSRGRFVVLAGLVPGRSYVASQAALVRMAELDLLAGDVAVSCH